MPSGSKPDLDKRIPRLIAQLKAALVQRARQRIEAQVDGRVAALVAGLERVVAGHADGGDVPAAIAATPASAASGRKPRTAASLAAQAAKTRAVWARKKAAKGKAVPKGT